MADSPTQRARSPGRAGAGRPGSQPAAGRPALRGTQTLIHGIVLLLGWAGFFALWWRIALRPWTDSFLPVLLTTLLIALPAVTLLWVVHNIDLHRRKGPRTRVLARSGDSPPDTIGSGAMADWAALRNAQIVVIEEVGGVKQYRAAGQ